MQQRRMPKEYTSTLFPALAVVVMTSSLKLKLKLKLQLKEVTGVEVEGSY